MSKQEAKLQIEKLIEKFRRISEIGKIPSYNEAQTRNEFIEPLFEYLGWDMRNLKTDNEVTTEEKVSRGRVDLAFRQNSIPVMFLEAKAIKADLDDRRWAEQVITYSWNKSVTWAVLTNFEVIKIFNAEAPPKSLSQNLFVEIKWDEFISRFDQLWLLSKESMEKGLLDKEAEKWGKKTKRIPVDKQLLADFTKFRELLSKNMTKLNQRKNLSEEELDEAVQRILDRLIFIKNCEDREIEEKKLSSGFREWESQGQGQLIDRLREVFAYFDEQYNSKIFANHLCDDLDVDNEVLTEIIEGLYYTKEKTVFYDFSAIEADVLGNIYEQYLGHILRKSKKRAKLIANNAHRKEQGIYYTPTYIVDYIVRNTLGELLKNKKENADTIRVLDPACGSGSFLIKAFDVIDTYYVKNDKNYSQTNMDFKTGTTFTTKSKILQNNIFGVDLDKQAVEIAELNLLLKISEKGHRLPLLQQNIKCGNSLIDNFVIAGDKAFKWEDEFNEAMQEGGFDVVIGNPPYIFARDRKFSNCEKKYYYEQYALQEYQINTYSMFIEKAYNLLKPNGTLGFIMPNNWLTIETFAKFRNFILKSCRDIQIVNIYDKVFEEANVNSCILIFKKGKPSKISLAEMKEGKFNLVGVFKHSDFEKNNNIISASSLKSDITPIIQKIESRSIQLGKISNVSTGLKAYQIGKGIPKQTDEIKQNRKFHSKQKLSSDYYPYLEGKDVGRYILSWSGEFLKYGDFLAEPRKSVPFKGARILIRQIPSKPPYCINAVFTNKEVLHDINNMVVFSNLKEYELKFILGIINSKVISYWFIAKFGKLQRKLFPQFKVKELKQFPIPRKPNSNIKNNIIYDVDKMLILHKRYGEFGGKKTDARLKIEEEIKRADTEIDNQVYKLYGLTKEEIVVVEKSLTI